MSINASSANMLLDSENEGDRCIFEPAPSPPEENFNRVNRQSFNENLNCAFCESTATKVCTGK